MPDILLKVMGKGHITNFMPVGVVVEGRFVYRNFCKHN